MANDRKRKPVSSIKAWTAAEIVPEVLKMLRERFDKRHGAV